MKITGKIIAINLISLALVVTIFELAVRAYVKPSEKSAGILLGYELPPIKIVPVREPPKIVQPRKPVGLTVEGVEITIGDLAGFRQEEPLIGYEPLPNARSENGWWYSNNIGARSVLDTAKEIPTGRHRILIFGDSYAQASRVPQKDAWTEILSSLRPDSEVVNLGVDGYSMAQAYLRFQKILSMIDYEQVIMVFVPTDDLWREINSIRYLGHGWEEYQIMPRYTSDEGSLTLRASPYESRQRFYHDNYPEISGQTRDHLSRYDRFYDPLRHEKPPVIGDLVSYKIFAAVASKRRHQNVWRHLKDPRSEALTVSREIFNAMNQDAKETGHTFHLIVLPTPGDLAYFRSSEHDEQWSSWLDVVANVCIGDYPCLDLGEEFKKLPPGAIDIGYDGSHFGPAMNRRIAEAVARSIDGL